MARKSTDDYNAEPTAGMNRLVAGAIAAALLVMIAVVFLATSGSPDENDDESPAGGAGQTGDIGVPKANLTAAHDCDNCPVMVTMPLGSFTMGALADELVADKVAPLHAQTEGPARRVSFNTGFALSRTEVTRGQFTDFAIDTGHYTSGCVVFDGANWIYDENRSWREPGFAQSDDDPVVCVGHEDAAAYALWLSQRTLNPYRLPTEAEWEYAARGGSQASRPWGQTTEGACTHANVAGGTHNQTYQNRPAALIFPCDSGASETTAVAGFAANAYGLHDLFGNARELVRDCWTDNHQTTPPPSTRSDDTECKSSISKGGGWADPPANLRVTRRIRVESGERRSDQGFRVAKDILLTEDQPE